MCELVRIGGGAIGSLASLLCVHEAPSVWKWCYCRKVVVSKHRNTSKYPKGHVLELELKEKENPFPFKYTWYNKSGLEDARHENDGGDSLDLKQACEHTAQWVSWREKGYSQSIGNFKASPTHSLTHTHTHKLTETCEIYHV